MSEEKTKPSIQPAPNGPYLVTDLENLQNRHGPIESKPKMALCRCGESNNKPFCDGTHATIGFSSEKLEGRVPDKRAEYEGQGITVHDNRGICAHAGHCTGNLSSVFKLSEEPWIDPDGATVKDIINTIKKCPSGALSYTIDNVEHRDQDREPMVTVTKDGPYAVTGGIELVDQPLGEEASTEHYTLCRCGGSKNKPFCDGTHWHIGFKDEKN